jgi:DNA-directed RNA polymerase subunit M/transcription elongation factor TFIIS
MSANVKLCDKCTSAMIKKQSGSDVYYECQHCGKKEDK